MKEAVASWREVVLLEVRNTLKRVSVTNLRPWVSDTEMVLVNVSVYRLSRSRTMTRLVPGLGQGSYHPICPPGRIGTVSFWPHTNGGASFRSTAVQEVRSLDQDAFVDLARIMYGSFLNCIEGLQAQNGIIIEVLEAIPYVQVSFLVSHTVC